MELKPRLAWDRRSSRLPRRAQAQQRPSTPLAPGDPAGHEFMQEMGAMQPGHPTQEDHCCQGQPERGNLDRGRSMGMQVYRHKKPQCCIGKRETGEGAPVAQISIPPCRGAEGGQQGKGFFFEGLTAVRTGSHRFEQRAGALRT